MNQRLTCSPVVCVPIWEQAQLLAVGKRFQSDPDKRAFPTKRFPKAGETGRLGSVVARAEVEEKAEETGVMRGTDFQHHCELRLTARARHRLVRLTARDADPLAACSSAVSENDALLRRTALNGSRASNL
eukprot:symbB.v1.2.007724.t1/scaffold423.1/size207292/3